MWSKFKFINWGVLILGIGLGLVGYGLGWRGIKIDKAWLKRAMYVSGLVNVEKYKVIYVVDGDTVGVDTKERIRLLGVDTPELHSRNPIEVCLALEAKKFTKSLVDKKIIYAIRDVRDIDKYGRLLRYVFLNKDKVGDLRESINYVLVREGYAKVLTIPPDVAHNRVFLEAERKAKYEKKGLWGDKCQKIDKMKK